MSCCSLVMVKLSCKLKECQGIHVDVAELLIVYFLYPQQRVFFMSVMTKICRDIKCSIEACVDSRNSEREGLYEVGIQVVVDNFEKKNRICLVSPVLQRCHFEILQPVGVLHVWTRDLKIRYLVNLLWHDSMVCVCMTLNGFHIVDAYSRIGRTRVE